VKNSLEFSDASFNFLPKRIYYTAFKVFRKSVWFRQHKIHNSGIVRRKYVKRKRLTSNIQTSKILKYWAFYYFKLQQTWRAYQLYGIFNLNLISPNYMYYFKTYKKGVSHEYLNVLSYSNKTILNTNTRFLIANKNNWKTLAKGNRNSMITVYDSPEVLNYFSESKYMLPSLIKDDFLYYPISILYQKSLLYNMNTYRNFIFKLILKKIITFRKILVHIVLYSISKSTRK